MQINDRLRRARVSGTIRLAQAARALQEAGRKVIDLGEGEPDFDTPSHIIDAAFDAARHGATRYTNVAGTTALRQVIAQRFTQKNAIDSVPESIIVGSGAKQLIFNALVATLEPGDEVVVPVPHWVSYPDMVVIAGGVPVLVDCPAAEGFRLTPERLAAAITPRTRWLILNSPSNPTGAVLSADELSALAEVLRGAPQVAVLSDDIYQDILFDNVGFASMAEVAPDLRDRTLTVDGVSKSYAMTGWRIGYATGPADLIAAMTKLQGQSTTNACSVSQAAALAALEGPQDCIADWRAAYARRRDLVATALGDVPGLVFHQPQGAFYHFIGCADLLGRRTPGGVMLNTDNDLSLHLLESAGVCLVPGYEFGAPGHLRLCFAKSEADLDRACAAVRTALAALTD